MRLLGGRFPSEELLAEPGRPIRKSPGFAPTARAAEVISAAISCGLRVGGVSPAGTYAVRPVETS